MAKQFTMADIKAMTLLRRKALYDNCIKDGGSEAQEILSLILASGEPYAKDESVKDGDPIFRAMELIINSSANESAMLSMVNRGVPPIAAIDPLLAKELGSKYGKHNESTIQAGYLVARRMEALGLVKGNQVALPKGCVARSGTKFHYPPQQKQ